MILDSSDSDDDGLPVVEMSRSVTNPPRWTDVDLKEADFIDDMTRHEKCPIDMSFSAISTKKEERLIWAAKSEEFLNNVRVNCSERGMLLNDNKTQILCISTAINYEVRSFIRLQDGPRISSDTLKVVGFTLSLIHI